MPVRSAPGKVVVNSASSVSTARRGLPAARRRDRNRSVWRPARPHALCAAPPRMPPSRTNSDRLRASLSRGPAPHASHGRPRFPAVRPQHGRRYLRGRPLTTARYDHRPPTAVVLANSEVVFSSNTLSVTEIQKFSNFPLSHIKFSKVEQCETSRIFVTNLFILLPYFLNLGT